jgi:hypothetical protein
VIVWASGFENFWNDLAVQPVFLPHVHQLAKYLVEYEEPRPFYRVGNVIDLWESPIVEDGDVSAGTELFVERPVGGPSVLRLSEENRFLQLNEIGFHRVGYVGGDDDGAFVVATNLDPRESDLTAIDPEEMAGALTAEGDAEVTALEAIVLSPEDLERRQGLWWYLLVGAATLLLLETLISNWLSRAKPAKARS